MDVDVDLDVDVVACRDPDLGAPPRHPPGLHSPPMSPLSRRALRLACAVVAALLAILVVGVVAVANPTLPRRPAGGVEVDPAELAADVAGLVGAGGFRQVGDPTGLAAAAAFVRRRFEDAGHRVVEQAYPVDGHEVRNLLVEWGPPGAPLVVVGAHYDVCGDQPGADDNASGVAGVLALARLLAHERPELRHRLQLVAYTLEEPPHFRLRTQGSAVHAAALAARGERVRGAVVLEMIGYFADAPGSQRYPSAALPLLYPGRGDFVAVVGRFQDWGLTRAVKTGMALTCAVPVRSMNAPATLPGVDYSDHRSYWPHGWPAVMVTDTAFFRNPNYHQPTDTADTLDYSRMAEVVEGVYAAVVALD